MTVMSESHSNQRVLSGPVRVDERIPRLAARLEPGEIAVIEIADLDRSSALNLLSQRPLAVLNAAPSTTGRKASLGAKLLVEAGIAVIDDLGSDLMALVEGETVHIRGSEVYRGDELVASGNHRVLSELQDPDGEVSQILETSIQSFAQGAAIAWQSESAMLLDGVGIPLLSELAGKGKHGRPALVVTPGERTGQELRALRRYVRDYSPAIIAVSEAANLVSILGRKPDVVIGDPSGVKEKILRGGARLVLLERPDGAITGVEKISNYGLEYLTIPTSAGAVDTAILLADLNSMTQIVVVGQAAGIVEFLDRTTAEATSGFFTHARCRDKVVSASVVAELYRPGIATWQLIALLLAALCVMFAALFLTPWGGDLGRIIMDSLAGIWPSAALGGHASVVGGYPAV